MKLDAKTIYAQSSDIKARTYLEYRKDMKKKAIAELKIGGWLENKLKEEFKSKDVEVQKYGGDKYLWFLRKGGITREPDFVAKIDDKKIFIEFQYAEKLGLNFYDFKVSKVAKKKGAERNPIENKYFVYIHKPLLKFAIFTPKWVTENGDYGFVSAWRSYAFRVPKNRFESVLEKDLSLKDVVEMIDAKNCILLFQHRLIEIWKGEFS